MLKLDMETAEVKAKLVTHGPKNIDRAVKSALGSLGYKVAAEVKKQIRGGFGWPRKATRFPRKKGMRWWARFIRYRVYDEQAENIKSGKGVQSGAQGMTLVVLPAKDGRQGGQAGSYTKQRDSKFLSAVFHRFEHGERIHVSASMKKKLAAMSGRKLKMRKETTEINFPARPIFGPAWNRQKQWAPAFFTHKFLDNLDRYMAGVSVRKWKKMKA